MPSAIRWFWTDAGNGGWRSAATVTVLAALSRCLLQTSMCFPGPDRGQRLPTARIGNGVDDGGSGTQDRGAGCVKGPGRFRIRWFLDQRR